MNSIFDLDDRLNLYGAIAKAINVAFSNINLSEPQLVANLACGLPAEINCIDWNSSAKLKAGSVFVHRQPFVQSSSFPNKASVEIGDLLLIRSEMVNGVEENRRSLLLQAKKISKFPATPDNENQHYLYAQWPEFEYVRSGEALNGKARHVVGLDLYYAARYLLIGGRCFHYRRHPCFCFADCECLFHDSPHCSLTASPSMPMLSCYRCFENELFNFILGNAGKSFMKPAPKTDIGWDKVMEDLMDLTSQRYSKEMGSASGSKNQKSSRGVACFLQGDSTILKSMLSVDANIRDVWSEPPHVSDFTNDGDDDSGISIIKFVISPEADDRKPE